MDSQEGVIMKLRYNENGAMGGKALIVFVVVLVIALAYLSGLVSFSLPTPVSGEYDQRVIRGTTDVGIRVPIELRLTFNQDASSGSNKATVDAFIKHKHESLGSDENYVPDPKVVSTTSFNTDVANVGDVETIWAMNGVSFLASNLTYNNTLTSLSTVNYGNSQGNYKVWTTGTQYTPVLTADNSALLVQTTWKHYRKATNELLSADTVSWIVYYQMPTYNVDDSYTLTYTYYVYVPFNDYAIVEDINWDVRGYFENCIIEWTTVSVVTHEYWDFPLLNQYFPSGTGSIKLVRSRDTTLATAISYSWTGPTDLNIANSNQYGSHSYQYKIR